MGNASPSEILGSADRVSSRPVCGKTAPWTQTPAYIPFGAGPRICIGLWFALSEAEIVMAQLLSRYTISLPGARPVLPVGRVTIEPSYEPLFRLEAL